MLYVYPKHIKYTISIDSLLFPIIPDDFDNPMIKSLNLPTLSVALCFAAVQKQAPRRDARVSLLGRWFFLVGGWASEKYEFITWCKIRNSMDQHVPSDKPYFLLGDSYNFWGSIKQNFPFASGFD